MDPHRSTGRPRLEMSAEHSPPLVVAAAVCPKGRSGTRPGGRRISVLSPEFQPDFLVLQRLPPFLTGLGSGHHLQKRPLRHPIPALAEPRRLLQITSWKGPSRRRHAVGCKPMRGRDLHWFGLQRSCEVPPYLQAPTVTFARFHHPLCCFG